MATKITWTHVDAHVRRQCELVGMLPIGANDAEVAYNYLKYVEGQLETAERLAEVRLETMQTLGQQLKVAEAKPAKVGKTKQRLGALEQAVAELQSRGFVEKLIAACEQVNSQMVQEKADPFGPRDADGWYTWNGNDTMRPVGQVFYTMRDGGRGRDNDDGDIVKWRPAQ